MKDSSFFVYFTIFDKAFCKFAYQNIICSMNSLMGKKYKIAVDGFSSCGKSTLAKQIAQRLGVVYIDSGAMYRAVALIALRKNCVEKDSVNKDCLKPLVENVKIEFQPSDNHLILNGEDVELEIRGKEVASHVSEVAKHGFCARKNGENAARI
jgi:cytidylate kinase